MPNKKILVTGGAGYIGSHVVLKLAEAAEHVVVLDNLSTGFESAVLAGEFIKGDAGNRDLVARLIAEHDIDTIMHFAARTIVPESVEKPLRYYGGNTCTSRNLIQCAVDGGVKHFVFSSTAAVYGLPIGGQCSEKSPTQPNNPYGRSKLMTEWMLRDACAVSDMSYVTLRYFNVAGCDPKGRIGQCTKGATLLVKVACEAAVGKRDKICIMGTDYDTPDGTGVRDYIHVDDLANAHLEALKFLRAGNQSTTLNCGYGHGYSVREVLSAVEKANGKPLPVEEGPRRAGDLPTLIANCDRVKGVLGWKPKYDDLNQIVTSALRWEKKLAVSP